MGKKVIMKGSDFIRQIDVFPVQLLDGDPKSGIKLVATYDISPSAFPNTRLELLSNTYQLYRFLNVVVTYTSTLPTSVNGLYIAYIDTDPDEALKPTTVNDVLRIARSHQGSVQGKVKDNWSVSMPRRNDDQYFFIGGNGDARLTIMGKLYIYQVGQATRFDGTPLTEELSAGALNLSWTVEFMNPQLQMLHRIYDPVSQKDVIRQRHNTKANWVYLHAPITTAHYITNSRFRQGNIVIPKGILNSSGGPGNYIVKFYSVKHTIPNTVKSYNYFSLPYSNGRYKLPGTDLFTAQANSKVPDPQSWLEKAFKFATGGFEIAKEIYDIGKTIVAGFLASQATGALVTIDLGDTNTTYPDVVTQETPLGQCLIYWDGTNEPLVQILVEFNDAAHANDPTTPVSASTGLTLIRLDGKLNLGGPVEEDDSGRLYVLPALPYLPKLT
jgi:hypothetical protein